MHHELLILSNICECVMFGKFFWLTCCALSCTLCDGWARGNCHVLVAWKDRGRDELTIAGSIDVQSATGPKLLHPGVFWCNDWWWNWCSCCCSCCWGCGSGRNCWHCCGVRPLVLHQSNTRLYTAGLPHFFSAKNQPQICVLFKKNLKKFFL